MRAAKEGIHPQVFEEAKARQCQHAFCGANSIYLQC